MQVHDSRRLTGPNVVSERPGAILDLALEPGEGPAEVEAAIAAWQRRARAMLDALGWAAEATAVRRFPGGFSLMLSAPLDALYAATEVNEWAWSAARSDLAPWRTEAEPPRAAADRDPTASPSSVSAELGQVGAGLAASRPDEAELRLRAAIARESNPRLLAMQSAASGRGLTFLADDDLASVGTGAGSQTWGVEDLPRPDAVSWSAVHEVPVALVTGTNGKTTTVRLLAAMAKAAGQVPGLCSTDWIAVGDEILDRDDWAGPGGARRVLRDRRVTLAVLETARGGMLRRGLAVAHADVAAITNIGEDHLGEYGLADLDMLADAKFVVARAARALVLNAEDPKCRERGQATGLPLTWFALEPAASDVGGLLAAHRAAGGRACLLEAGRLVACEGERRVVLARVDEVPITLGGAARHNVANALAAVGLAWAIGLSWDAIRQGLTGFESDPWANPGRLNVFELGAATAVVDFAHNPHGLAALIDMASRLPAARRLVVLGQAGDRDDEAIRELARVAWRMHPDRVVVKELATYRRGRSPGEVPAIITGELLALGLDAGAIELAPDELSAVRAALAWAQPGDLLLLLAHSRRAAVLDLVAGLKRSGWRPGQTLPEAFRSDLESPGGAAASGPESGGH